MATQHAALMDKLDALLTDITTPPDYTDAFTDLSTKLAAISATLTVSRASLSAIQSSSANSLTKLTDIYNRLGDMAGYELTVSQKITLIQETMGLHTDGAEFTLASLVRAIATTGTSIYDVLTGLASPWPADVLAALECVCDSIRSQLPIDPLDETKQPPTCIEHYMSSGFNLFPAVPPITSSAIIYATFEEPLPDGIEYGTSLLGDLDNGILTSADWSGFSVFVKSDEPQYADDPLQPERYPTNQWRTMAGSGARVFSVSERGSIEVHFCKLNPYAIPEGECISTASDGSRSGHQTFTLNALVPDTYTFQAIDNFYMYDPDYTSASGPFAAGVAHSVATLRTGGKTQVYFGYSTSDPTVTIQICNPAPL